MQRKWKEKDMMLRPFRQGWWISRYRVYLNVWPNAYFRYACPAKLDLWFGCFECLFRLWPGPYLFLDSVFRRGIELFYKRNASFKRNGTERCQMMIELNYLNLKPPTRLVLFWTQLLQDPVRHRILWQVSSC